jgi:hypothetical protein
MFAPPSVITGRFLRNVRRRVAELAQTPPEEIVCRLWMMRTPSEPRRHVLEGRCRARAVRASGRGKKCTLTRVISPRVRSFPGRTDPSPPPRRRGVTEFRPAGLSDPSRNRPRRGVTQFRSRNPAHPHPAERREGAKSSAQRNLPHPHRTAGSEGAKSSARNARTRPRTTTRSRKNALPNRTLDTPPTARTRPRTTTRARKSGAAEERRAARARGAGARRRQPRRS